MTTSPTNTTSVNPEKVQRVDFKMVSFTLAGKEYGVDIMKVKEIRKAGDFTKVPNTPTFVRGVDNLRGDIIPIIDLRIMFHLPAETREDHALENIIILRLDDLVLGVVVDTIEKVVGVAKEAIQPPHPLFGDINIQYIQGVVEYNNILFILLDVDRIFGKPPRHEESPTVKPEVLPEDPPPAPVAAVPDADLDLQFISESLRSLAGFYVGPINREWVSRRLAQWKADRKAQGQDFQLQTRDEAQDFLKGFLTANSSRFWTEQEMQLLTKDLRFSGNNISVWNPGCGKGYEAYSLAILFRTQFPQVGVKIWASDNDLLNISIAPSLAVPETEIENFYHPFLVQTKTGAQFSSEVKSQVFFEFHDIRNMNPIANVSLIVARDVVSFLTPEDRDKVFAEFYEKLKPEGYLILGQNETAPQEVDWKQIAVGPWTVFQKNI